MRELDWDLLTRYLAGACAPAEREVVEAWLAASQQNREILADLRRVGALAEEVAAPERQAAILASLKREWTQGAPELRLVPDPERAPVRAEAFVLPLRRWSHPAKIAAAAVLVVSTGAIGRALLRPSSVGSTIATAPSVVLANAPGERRAVRLSDGTLVALAPASRLRIAPGYGIRDRVVELEGEAVFTVTHDSTRPFTVRTARAVARDLGTRFAVRAYSDDPATDVVVAEGSVGVTYPARAKSSAVGNLVARRGQRVRVAPDGSLALTSGVPLDRYFAWTEGRLVFQDTPLSDAVVQLGRWYAIDVRLSSAAIGARRLTASFRDEPTSEALRVVAAVLNLDVSRAGSTYTLRAK